MEGRLQDVDGRPALRFERRLAHPVQRVWRAISERDELAAWFVAPMAFEAEGQRFEAMDQPGEVLRLEPERALEWEWGGERFLFELFPDGDGTRLVFVHVFASREHGADYASGWHFHFERLDAHLAGRPVPAADPARLVELNDRYADQFGLDREVGRQVIAEHYGTSSG
jgi:uncharacterized protein YndB with AHSA1/START domain